MLATSGLQENKMNKRFQAALKREPQIIPPIWLMRQAGRYHKHYQALRAKHGFVELCKIPELAAETTMGPIRDFDFDAAILFSDLLFPLEAMGMGLKYDPAPQLEFQLNPETFSRLRGGDEAKAILDFQGVATQACREVLPKDKSLIGFVGGPWTLFVYAVEGSHKGSLTQSKKLLLNLYPRFCELLLPLIEYTTERQLKGGAEVVMIFDTAAGELSPADFELFNAPWLAKLAAKFPGKLGYYGKGTTEAHLGSPILQASNFAGRGIDHRFEISKILPNHTRGFLQGNFDQSLLHLEPADFQKALQRYLAPIRELSPLQRAGWVAGLGHGVLPQTPEANVKSYVETIRKTFG